MLIRTGQVLPANLLRVNVSKQVSRRKVFLSLLPFVQQHYHPEEEEVWKSTAAPVLPVPITISGVERVSQAVMHAKACRYSNSHTAVGYAGRARRGSHELYARIWLLVQKNVEMFPADASFPSEMLLCIYSFLNP